MMQYLENWCAKHRSSFVSVFLWLVLCVCFFSPAVFNNKVIAPMDCLECYFRPFADAPIEETHNHFVSDGVSQYLPYKWAIKKSFQEDGYVGWDPLTFNGRPIANNTMASPGDPWNLMYAILPFWAAWDWGIISQFFIVKEISFACGFADEKYFSRAFKKRYGYPPSQLKNNMIV